jgi:NAD-dependent SIR2 family protein deacetylase
MSNLERAIEALTNATRVVCFTGAGASASAGLHTFRGQNAGNMAQVREDGMDQVFPNVTYKALSALVAR